ncbi:type IV secretory system conjugative DNA transfer family protein [Oleiharenicola lentus]|uniref:type IV secretory system conjugative DNA transfer family protein n=1 Tax=Oleiharenicola lentus TaxID=2508720 RepID=UPI003F67E738
MLGMSDRLSAEFLAWERRGRGFQVWEYPVELEPAFKPFPFHGYAATAPADDGRKPTFLSSLVRRASQRLAPPLPDAASDPREDAAPAELSRGELVELHAHVPDGWKGGARHAEFLRSLSVSVAPIAFEVVGTSEKIVLQFAVHPRDERLFRRQFEAFFPDAALAPASRFLESAWNGVGEGHVAAVEFGLGKEFMVPFEATGGEPYVGLMGALSELGPGEVAVFQTIFAPASSPWGDSALRSVSRGDGGALFRNAPELLAGAQKKFSSAPWAAVVRVAVKTVDVNRTWEVACNVAGALGAYGAARGNHLVPLENESYPSDAHERDVLLRQTRRSGMILSLEEVAGFAHLPGAEARSPRLRSAEKTREAPARVREGSGVVLGENTHYGASAPVFLSNEDRVRHMHVVGVSGTGKSSLFYNLAMQDVERGEGVTVIDPHGDLVDRILGAIPESRIGDVVVFDPSDETHVVGLNILSAHSDWEKGLLAADLVSVFRRLSTSWGDQLNSVLHNAILAFLESERGGTLIDLRRFLLEPAFRREFLKTVRDPNVSYYWEKAFPQLSGGKSIGPVITRLDTFLGPRPIREMVAQAKNSLDLGDVLDSGKILLARLPIGIIGEDSAYLLGSLLVAKMQSEAMSRQRKSASARRDHFLFADEFHNFLTPSIAACLSGVRKYRLGLVLGHQEMWQVERETGIASALSNAFTRVVFRVGDKDSRNLEGGFSSFEARDLQNLETGCAICRVERSDCDFNLTVPMPKYPPQATAAARAREVVAASRLKYSTLRSELPQAGEAIPSSVILPEKIETPVVLSEPQPSETPPAPAPVEIKMEPITPARKQTVPSASSTDLGKGGAQHKAVQDRVKEEAEKIGFRVVVEKRIDAGSIDLVLSRDGVDIACEVTVTNTIDYEVGNVSKCIRAGFGKVAVVGVSEDKLAKLSAAVANSLGAEKAKLVGLFLPDAFIEHLRALPKLSSPAAEVPRTRGGRVVRRTFTPVSEAEAKTKESEALRIMSEMMQKKKSSERKK